MNPFKVFSSSYWRNKNSSQRQAEENNTKNLNSLQNSLTIDDEKINLYCNPFTDDYLYNAWVNIAVNILIRNIARADYVLEREGVEVKSGPLYALFHKPNSLLSRYDLWKETAAW